MGLGFRKDEDAKGRSEKMSFEQPTWHKAAKGSPT